MPIDLFGFSIGRKGKVSPKSDSNSSNKNLKSFVPPDMDDGATVVEAGGFYGSYIDFDGSIKTDIDLINKYRDMSLHPEIEIAVDDIVNDAIVYDEKQSPVEILLDEIDYSDSIKSKIKIENTVNENKKSIHTTKQTATNQKISKIKISVILTIRICN